MKVEKGKRKKTYKVREKFAGCSANDNEVNKGRVGELMYCCDGEIHVKKSPGRVRIHSFPFPLLPVDWKTKTKNTSKSESTR